MELEPYKTGPSWFSSQYPAKINELNINELDDYYQDMSGVAIFKTGLAFEIHYQEIGFDHQSLTVQNPDFPFCWSNKTYNKNMLQAVITSTV